MRRTWLIVLALLFALPASAAVWRSALYPEGWTPGYSDEQGRFLHDFSYAGYRRGEEPIPGGYGGRVIDVTRAPYGADNTGVLSASAAIQRAIDAAGRAGGGVVYLPEGTYRLALREEAPYALSIPWDNVILRGAGRDRTKLYCPDTEVRGKRVIQVGAPVSHWLGPHARRTFRLAEDADALERTVSLHTVRGLRAGDWVVIRASWTQEFIDEHGMGDFWAPTPDRGPALVRRILSVDARAGTVRIDIPVRLPMRVRDGARLDRYNPSVTGVGLENFSIGAQQVPREPGAPGWAPNDYQKEGADAYKAHGACLIRFSHVVDGWARNIASYRPESNTGNFHMPSDGLDLFACRSVSVLNCDFSRPQYEGGGGNGSGFVVRSGDCLIANCSSTSARHSFSFKGGQATGNVIYAFRSTGARLPSDFHMFLSAVNLIDGMTLARDVLEARVRPDGAAGRRHGLTTTQSVFWNTRGEEYRQAPDGERFIIDSRQWGQGYVIGTSGPADQVKTTPLLASLGGLRAVETAPEDFVEGVGEGEGLRPRSLYLDQLARRLRPGDVHELSQNNH